MSGWHITICAGALVALGLLMRWMVVDVRRRARRAGRRIEVQLARFRTADDVWGDRELRKREYQAALRLAIASGNLPDSAAVAGAILELRRAQ